MSTTIREEWEVTGDPGENYPAYRWVFGSPRFNNDGESVRRLGDTPEEQARSFMRVVTRNWPVATLRRRTVTETEWEEVVSKGRKNRATAPKNQ
jgi:hypothetical protein